jgi:hypothetical protein
MPITITLDEAVSERVAGISLAELTRYAQEGILSRLEQNNEGGSTPAVAAPLGIDTWVTEATPLDEPWDEETVSAVRESMHEVQEVGVTYSQEEADEHIVATLARWKADRQK